MDEKKYTGGFENPEEGQENQQAGQNPNAAEHQETSGSGWVFSMQKISSRRNRKTRRSSIAKPMPARAQARPASQMKRAGTAPDRSRIPKQVKARTQAITAATATTQTRTSRAHRRATHTLLISRQATQRQAKATNGIMRIIRRASQSSPLKIKRERTRDCVSLPSSCVQSCAQAS